MFPPLNFEPFLNQVLNLSISICFHFSLVVIATIAFVTQLVLYLLPFDMHPFHEPFHELVVGDIKGAKYHLVQG